MSAIVPNGVASQDRLAELVEELTARLKSGEAIDLVVAAFARMRGAQPAFWRMRLR